MRAAAKPPAARKEVADQQRSALAAVVDRIEQEGGEFVGEQLVQQLLNPQARPAREPVWLTPREAGIKRREVWTAKTASGAEVQVLLTSHRRAGSVKRAWFGLSLRTKAEVRVVKVLEGSGIGT